MDEGIISIKVEKMKVMSTVRCSHTNFDDRPMT